MDDVSGKEETDPPSHDEKKEEVAPDPEPEPAAVEEPVGDEEPGAAEGDVADASDASVEGSDSEEVEEREEEVEQREEEEEDATNESSQPATSPPTGKVDEVDVDTLGGSKSDHTVPEAEEETIDSSQESDFEMRKKLLDQKERELAEREENLQKSLRQLEEDQKKVNGEKQKLASLLEKLVDVEASIQDLLWRDKEPKPETKEAASPLPTVTAKVPKFASPAVGDKKESLVLSPAILKKRESIPISPLPLFTSPKKESIPPSTFTAPTASVGAKSSQDLPIPPSGACYLAYEPDSSGRLVEYYSKTTPVQNAIGRWVTVGTKSIAGFKFKSHGNVIIAGCSGGVHGRKNYFSGWCSFVRSACHMQSELIMWDPPGIGLNVDVWVYTNDPRPGKQSVKLEPGRPIQTEGVLGVAVLPKKTQFYDQAMTIDFDKWLGEGFDLGGSARI